MISSVKFLHPTTMRGRPEHEVRVSVAQTKSSKKIIGRARIPTAPELSTRPVTARVEVVPSRAMPFMSIRRARISRCLWRSESAPQPSQPEIRREGHQRCGNSARQDHGVVHHRQTAKNEFSQAACANCRGYGGKPDRNHNRNTHAGQNHTGGK